MPLSDNVINNIVSTIGTVVATVVPTLAVVLSRRSTKKDLRNVHTEVRDVKRELLSINDTNTPGPTISQIREDREQRRDVTRENGGSNARGNES